MVRNRLLRILLLSVGVGVTCLGTFFWRASRQSPLFNTAPLDIPIQLKSGTQIRAPFALERPETYVVNVEFATPRRVANVNDLEAATDQIDIAWQVFASGKRMASGRSPSRTWFHAGDMTGKNVGEFFAQPGTYIIEATVLGVPSTLAGIDTRFSILLNQKSMTDLGYTIELMPYLGYGGVGLAVLGITILICTWLPTRY